MSPLAKHAPTLQARLSAMRQETKRIVERHCSPKPASALDGRLSPQGGRWGGGQLHARPLSPLGADEVADDSFARGKVSPLHMYQVQKRRSCEQARTQQPGCEWQEVETGNEPQTAALLPETTSASAATKCFQAAQAQASQDTRSTRSSLAHLDLGPRLLDGRRYSRHFQQQ